MSDALALAAQTNCSISVTDDILQNMGLDLPEGQTKVPQDWALCEAILQIPEECSRLTFGMFLFGTGQVWFNEVQVTTMDQFSQPETVAPLSETSVPLNADPAQGAVKQVISDAQEEARHFQHNFVGTEHLLLALYYEPGAAELLRILGAEGEKVRRAVATIIGRGKSAVSGEIELTPRSKKVLELAQDEARLLR